MRYSEIAHAENIHADKNIDACVKRYFRNAHHREHNLVREADVD